MSFHVHTKSRHADQCGICNPDALDLVENDHIKDLQKQIDFLKEGEKYGDKFMAAVEAFLRMQFPDKMGIFSLIDWHENIKKAIEEKKREEQTIEELKRKGYRVTKPIIAELVCPKPSCTGYDGNGSPVYSVLVKDEDGRHARCQLCKSQYELTPDEEKLID